MEILLTEEERRLVCEISGDFESGNYLIHLRSERYWEFLNEFMQAMNTENPTEKQLQIREYHHQCSDYFYYESLPNDKKLF